MRFLLLGGTGQVDNGQKLPVNPAAIAGGGKHVAGRIEIPEAGHGAHLTHPDAFAGFVRAALARADDPNALSAPVGGG